MPDDPTRIGAQPTLTTSTGRMWLIVGGLFTIIAMAVLIPMIQLRPPGLALTAAIAVAALYAAMVVVRVVVPSGRRRLVSMAAGMLAIALISLLTTAVVASCAALAP